MQQSPHWLHVKFSPSRYQGSSFLVSSGILIAVVGVKFAVSVTGHQFRKCSLEDNISDSLKSSKGEARPASIVLCGGQSRRMGQDKSGVLFQGIPMLSRVCQRLEPATMPIVVVAAARQSLPCLPTSVDVVRDEYPDQGPLGGLLTGLSFLRHREPEINHFALTGCDAPFVNTSVLLHMFELLCKEQDMADGHILRQHGRRQPFHAVYRTSICDRVADLFEAGQRSLRALLDALNLMVSPAREYASCDPHLAFLHNINTEKDLHAATRFLDSCDRQSE